jgi:hypothetical protein
MKKQKALGDALTPETCTLQGHSFFKKTKNTLRAAVATRGIFFKKKIKNTLRVQHRIASYLFFKTLKINILKNETPKKTAA